MKNIWLFHIQWMVYSYFFLHFAENLFTIVLFFFLSSDLNRLEKFTNHIIITICLKPNTCNRNLSHWMHCSAEQNAGNAVLSSPNWFNFRHIGTACSCTLNISSLKKVQLSWTPLPFRATSHGTPLTMSLNRPKSTLWKAKFSWQPSLLIKDQTLHHSVISMPKAAPNHYTTHKP